MVMVGHWQELGHAIRSPPGRRDDWLVGWQMVPMLGGLREHGIRYRGELCGEMPRGSTVHEDRLVQLQQPVDGLGIWMVAERMRRMVVNCKVHLSGRRRWWESGQKEQKSKEQWRLLNKSMRQQWDRLGSGGNFKSMRWPCFPALVLLFGRQWI